MTEPNRTDSPVEADGHKADASAAPAPAPIEPAAQETAVGAAAGRADRPEVAVAAAFAGGFSLALLLRRIAR